MPAHGEACYTVQPHCQATRAHKPQQGLAFDFWTTWQCVFVIFLSKLYFWCLKAWLRSVCIPNKHSNYPGTCYHRWFFTSSGGRDTQKLCRNSTLVSILHKDNRHRCLPVRLWCPFSGLHSPGQVFHSRCPRNISPYQNYKNHQGGARSQYLGTGNIKL